MLNDFMNKDDKGRNDESIEELNALKEKLLRLKKSRDAIILAHYYQRPEIQDIADYTGDSLDLSIKASNANEAVIVFCGVRFMAETAAILCPEKTVLLPSDAAGCPLADTATAEQVRRARKEYPDAVFIAYVNSSAEVKAECDVCCASANAVEIAQRYGRGKRIVFIPDRCLGHYVAAKTGCDVILWDGSCPTHVCLSPRDVKKAKERHPGAKLMVHPECLPEVAQVADLVGGTKEMLDYAKKEPSGTSFIVGTDIGLNYRLRRDNPDKEFNPATDTLVCPMMKLTTIEDVARSLETMKDTITVTNPVRDRAREAIKNMFRKKPAEGNAGCFTGLQYFPWDYPCF